MAALRRFAIAVLGIGVFVACACSFAQTKKPSDNLRSQIPEWAPIYPGAVAYEVKSNPGSVEHYVSFKLLSRDRCAKIIDWYERTLSASGYKTFARVDTDTSTTSCSSSVRSDSANRSRSIYLDAGSDMRGVTIAVEAVERGGASVNVGLPSWIPIYLGSRVGDIEVSKESPGRQYHFSFTSKDDPAMIYRWYQSQLAPLAFKCTFKTAPNSAGSFNGTASGRTFAIRNFPTPPAGTFVVDVRDH